MAKRTLDDLESERREALSFIERFEAVYGRGGEAAYRTDQRRRFNDVEGFQGREPIRSPGGAANLAAMQQVPLTWPGALRTPQAPIYSPRTPLPRGNVRPVPMQGPFNPHSIDTYEGQNPSAFPDHRGEAPAPVQMAALDPSVRGRPAAGNSATDLPVAPAASPPPTQTAGSLPPGFKYIDEEPQAPAKSSLPPGFKYLDDQAPPKEAAPGPSTPAPSAGISQLPEDPFERAAIRTSRSVVSPTRTEGETVQRAGMGLARAVGGELQRVGGIMERAVKTGDLPPKEAVEMALTANPVSAAFKTGVNVSRAAMTPFQLQQLETGVLSIPRAAQSGQIQQAVARGLSAAPVGGGKLRARSEAATRELQAAGEAAAARPSGTAATQNLAGSHVRRGVESAAEELRINQERLPRWMNQMIPKSNEDMIGTMARWAAESKTGANVNALAEIRKVVEPQRWAQVQSALISRMGQSPKTAQFDPATWVSNYGNLSSRGKSVLFGREGTSLRRHLDAIEEVSRRAPSWQQFQRERASLGSRAGVTALFGGATIMAPLATLSTVVPLAVLARGLARPMTAAPIAQWSRAYEKVITSNGAPNAIAAFTIATRNLNSNLGTDVDPHQLLRGQQDGQPVE